MPVKMKFDSTGRIICPNCVLMTRGCKVLGAVWNHEFRIQDSMENAAEIYFTVYKSEVPDAVWNGLTDFKIIFVPEWNALFSCSVDLEEAPDKTIKSVTAKALGESELSQINVYGLEINTEDDIARDDYKRSVLYNAEDAGASILDRVLEKAPHYSIRHVDDSIADIQRSFSFDGKDILSCLNEICEEIQCQLEIRTSFDGGKIIREIYMYDLLSYCTDCHERGEFDGVCGKCGSTNIKEGYGADTTIFISTANLTDDIQYSGCPDSVKNCFHLEAGDDLMTATVAACNPNGTSYLWNFSEADKTDMSDALAQKLNEYDSAYHEVLENFSFVGDTDVEKYAEEYNRIVQKYKTVQGSGAEEFDINGKGFSNAIHAYYSSVDFRLFLQSGMYPSFEMESTTADDELKKIHSEMFTVGVKNLKTATATSINNSVVAMVKTIVNHAYDVTIVDSAYNDAVWSGIIRLANTLDEEDVAQSGTLSFAVNDDYVNFTKQKIDKMLSETDNGKYDVASLFKSSIIDFKAELKKYCADGLEELHKVCQGCIDVLVQQGAAAESESPWSQLYSSTYVPYQKKLEAIEAEIAVREKEASDVSGFTDSILNAIRTVQKRLDIGAFLGDDLFRELASFRREDSYKNDNYISDGLTNAEIIQNASDFLDVAEKEIRKASGGTHQIEATLTNLFAVREFRKITANFAVGNWMRIAVGGNVYKLRLLEYEVDFDDPNETRVSFSDATLWDDPISDVSSVLSTASSMATSYGAVTRQAKNGAASKKTLNEMAKSGVSVSDYKIVSQGMGGQYQEWGDGGLVAKSYDKDEGRYDDKQLKLLNNGIFLTNDSWKTVRSAIGEFRYVDPVTGIEETLYGINAELLIGNLILGENLVIKNSSGTMSFDGGLNITNGVNTFIVNPNDKRLMRLVSGDEDLMYVDDTGKLFLRADGTDVNISGNEEVRQLTTLIDKNTDSINGHETRIGNVEKKADKNASDIFQKSAELESLVDAYSRFAADYDTFKGKTQSDLAIIKEKLGITDESEV